MERGSDLTHEMKVRLIEEDTEEGNMSFGYPTGTSIFLLVNPKSGSREGRCYTDLENDIFNIDLDDGQDGQLNIVNITAKKQMDTFKKNILKQANGRSKVIVVIVGGDGTFMNILKDLVEHGVATEHILFTVLPFGTSNDLSRTYNWGATPTQRMKTNLEYLGNMLNNAKEVPFDIWEVEVITNEDCGDISKADGQNMTSLGDHMTKLMAHSFSFGLDARVGLNFERRRTRSRGGNNVRYALEGLKRVFGCGGFSRTLKIRQIMSCFSQRLISNEEIKEGKKSINQDPEVHHDIESLYETPSEKIQSTEFDIKSDRNEEATYYIRGNPVSLYGTNISVLMGGRNNLWRGGRGRSGLGNRNGNAVPARLFKDPVYYNDGKLEFTTFASLFHLMLQKSRRVMQAGGPFVFEFNTDTAVHTFINIDGEFYEVTGLQQIRIQKYFKTSTLRVLINE